MLHWHRKNCTKNLRIFKNLEIIKLINNYFDKQGHWFELGVDTLFEAPGQDKHWLKAGPEQVLQDGWQATQRATLLS